MKKLLCILLVLVVIVSLLWVSPVLAEQSGDFTYSISNGTARITGYTGSGGDVIIPDELDGYTVTSIGNNAFLQCSGLTSVTIPDSVLSIGDSVFAYCRNLLNISIPNSVTSIGDNAFEHCNSLVSIDIPNGVSSIGSSMFWGCKSLSIINIPNSVTSIGDNAFKYCSSLSGITIPDSVTSIGGEAFHYCSGLTSINIPDSVINIGAAAFLNCSSLTSINIPESVTNISRFMFCGCTSLSSIFIPNSVTSIGDNSFRDCSSLTSIDIPYSVTSIGFNAFYGCYNLSAAYFFSDKPEFGQSVFDGNSSEFKTHYHVTKSDSWSEYTDYPSQPFCILTLNMQDGSTPLSSYIPVTSGRIEEPASPTRADFIFAGWYIDEECIDAWDFNNDIVLTDITLYAKWSPIQIYFPVYTVTYDANGATSGTVPVDSNTYSEGDLLVVSDNIGQLQREGYIFTGWNDSTDGSGTDYAADGTGSLTMGASSVVLYAKWNCFYTYTVSGTKATITGYSGTGGDITIPDTLDGYTVTSIGNNAFLQCGGLTSVTIPDSVTSIGDSAFSQCYGLTSVTMPDSVTSIGDSAFAYCQNLLNISIPNSVTSIGDYAFIQCFNFTSIIIPDSVISIGSNAFMFCLNLKSINIPNNIIHISHGVFFHCRSLTSIVIPESVTSIGESAFQGCWSLTSLNIPESVTSIGMYAFWECKSLTSIIIPESVTNISPFMFFNCISLKSIVIPNSVTIIDDGSFILCSSLTNIDIPNSVTSIGRSAFSFSGITSIVIPDSVTSIGDNAFRMCYDLSVAYFFGDKPEFGLDVFCDVSSEFKAYYHVTKSDSWSDYTDYPSQPFCILTLNMQDGSTPLSSYIPVTSGKIEEPDSPTRADFIFAGWYIDEECIDAWDFNNDIVLTDITLYAKWSPIQIYFPDENLETIIREATGKPEGEIYSSDISGITVLNAGGKSIIDLEGLQFFTSLTTLDLEQNHISDISKLAGLTNLTSLKLAGNFIVDISPLSDLASLTELTLGDNLITDFSPIKNIYNNLLIRDFEFVLIETPIGHIVQVQDETSGISLIFDEISEAGETTITTLYTPPSIDNYYVNMIPVYYEINSSATFDGNVIIEIPYNEEGLSVNESELRLYRLTNGKLEDITLEDPNNPDVENNIIRGIINDHFCTFFIGMPNRAPIANAGDDIILEATSSEGRIVTLDGSDSIDPDQDNIGLDPTNVEIDGKSIVTYTWTGTFGTATGMNPEVLMPVGVNELTLTVSDGDLESTDTVYVIIYDPCGGFATGGGWIDVEDPLLGDLGRASFGFIAKYKDSKSTGSLEFKSSDGDINLKSISIDWLVMNSSKAQFQGTATITGKSGIFTFRVACIDNKTNGKPDNITIKIWEGNDIEADPIYKALNVDLAGGNILCKIK